MGDGPKVSYAIQLFLLIEVTGYSENNIVSSYISSWKGLLPAVLGPLNLQLDNKQSDIATFFSKDGELVY